MHAYCDRRQDMFVTIFYNLMSSKRNNTMGAKQMQEVHLLSARSSFNDYRATCVNVNIKYAFAIYIYI